MKEQQTESHQLHGLSDLWGPQFHDKCFTPEIKIGMITWALCCCGDTCTRTIQEFTDHRSAEGFGQKIMSIATVIISSLLKLPGKPSEHVFSLVLNCQIGVERFFF